jgi:hypothetical protein
MTRPFPDSFMLWEIVLFAKAWESRISESKVVCQWSVVSCQ